MKEFLNYGNDIIQKQQALFASFFVVQNRLQTLCEKVQTEISMRQWHLLAMTQVCEKPRTLTNIGELMGCSRQNVKNLATALERKGFINFVYGANNSVQIEITEKANKYLMSMCAQQNEILANLFTFLSEKETNKFFFFFFKLLDGLEKVEEYANNYKGEHIWKRV